MEFEERLDKIISEHAATKAAIAREMGIPISTFMYKSKNLSAWTILDWRKLKSILRLSDEEEDFLCSEVTYQ